MVSSIFQKTKEKISLISVLASKKVAFIFLIQPLFRWQGRTYGNLFAVFFWKIEETTIIFWNFLTFKKVMEDRCVGFILLCWTGLNWFTLPCCCWWWWWMGTMSSGCIFSALLTVWTTFTLLGLILRFVLEASLTVNVELVVGQPEKLIKTIV